jgi:DNA-binding GntR family transcriptional regulator
MNGRRDTLDEPVAARSGAAEPLPISRRSLHREVNDRLRDMIVEGILAAGSRIDEKRLCEELGVSRTPLREALKVLASEGLIELRPNRGARVTRIDAETVEDLFEVVCALERFAGELAAKRASDADLARLGTMHERMVRHFENRQRARYFSLNHEIHKTIVAMAGNATLVEHHANVMVNIRRARYMAITSQERWEESVGEHAGILDALANRDGARAGRLIFQHDQKTGELVRKAVLANSEDATS